MQFYNVKTRSKVEVPDTDIKKTKYVRTTSKGDQVRYAVRANVNGTNLTKFVGKDLYESLDVPEEIK
ncbi:MAG: hypothetical protein M3P33_03180 [bacterium]|nr:hypothetical protein [bacterium]